MKCLGVSVFVVYMLTLSVMTAYSVDEEKKIDAKALFEEKCSLCHSVNRPKSKTKTANEWEKTVMRMKDVNGCPITDEEAKVIIEYLTEHYGK